MTLDGGYGYTGPPTPTKKEAVIAVVERIKRTDLSERKELKVLGVRLQGISGDEWPGIVVDRVKRTAMNNPKELSGLCKRLQAASGDEWFDIETGLANAIALLAQAEHDHVRRSRMFKRLRVVVPVEVAGKAFKDHGLQLEDRRYTRSKRTVVTITCADYLVLNPPRAGAADEEDAQTDQEGAQPVRRPRNGLKAESLA